MSQQVSELGSVPLPAKEQARPAKIEANSVVVRNGSTLGSVPLVSVPVLCGSVAFPAVTGRLAGSLGYQRVGIVRSLFSRLLSTAASITR